MDATFNVGEGENNPKKRLKIECMYVVFRVESKLAPKPLDGFCSNLHKTYVLWQNRCTKNYFDKYCSSRALLIFVEDFFSLGK